MIMSDALEGRFHACDEVQPCSASSVAMLCYHVTRSAVSSRQHPKKVIHGILATSSRTFADCRTWLLNEIGSDPRPNATVHIQGSSLEFHSNLGAKTDKYTNTNDTKVSKIILQRQYSKAYIDLSNREA